MNVLLNDNLRGLYRTVIDELSRTCPETTSKKYERANIQQAFVFDTVRNLTTDKKNTKILSVGSYHDTASEALVKLDYNVVEIDPVINMNLEQYIAQNPKEKFDIVMATSVLEHVEKDEDFIDSICNVLKDGGIAVLTCDFKDGWKQGDKKPNEDFRLYTVNDLTVRLNKILKKNNCDIHGNVDYKGEPDFEYFGSHYSFATFMFKKKDKTDSKKQK